MDLVSVHDCPITYQIMGIIDKQVYAQFVNVIAFAYYSIGMHYYYELLFFVLVLVLHTSVY